jgi:hypothetical protein
LSKAHGLCYYIANSIPHVNLPISIGKEMRLKDFNTLKEYAMNENPELFADIIAALETEKNEKYLSLALSVGA